MPRRHVRIKVSIGLLALLAAGCGQGDLFARLPDDESAEVAATPYPRLVDGIVSLKAAGPGPDRAQGAAIVENLSTEAALAQAEAQRLGVAVMDAETLDRDAEAVRRGR
jgi:hypothetical protein